MDFSLALKTVYNDNGKDLIKNPFFVYSCLSDLVKNDFNSMPLLRNYYLISKKINIFKILLDNGIDNGLNILKENYKYIKDIDFIVYKRCVYFIVLAIKPDYKFVYKANKKNEQKSNNKNNKNNKNVKKVSNKNNVNHKKTKVIQNNKTKVNKKIRPCVKKNASGKRIFIKLKILFTRIKHIFHR